MRLLLDTQLLLWLVYQPERLSALAQRLIRDPANLLFYSSVSIWEIAIKQALRRNDFVWSAEALLMELQSFGFVEVPLRSEHGLATLQLAALHGDPFDRILLAQAVSEQLTLVTADSTLAAYPNPILRV